MNDDTLAESGLIVLALVQLGALGVALIRGGGGPIKIMNLLISAGIVLWWLPALGEVWRGNYVDLIPAWLAFELLVLVCSSVAVAGVRIPSLIAWVAFAAHCALIALGLTFMFTFSMRMI